MTKKSKISCFMLAAFGVSALSGIVLLASTALAEVVPGTYSMTPTPVEVGENVTVDVKGVTKSGSGCENNWITLRATVDGIPYETAVNSDGGKGPVDSSVSFPAPSTPGTYPVVVELIGGDDVNFGVENTTGCDPNVWGTKKLSLDVTPKKVEPFFKILSISPLDQTRAPEGTIEYETEIEVGGYPKIGKVQCVVFDKYSLDDGYTRIDVESPEEPGTFLAETTFDLSGHATGTFTVKVAAFAESCDGLDSLDMISYFNEETTATTSLTIKTTDEVTPEPTPIKRGGGGKCINCDSKKEAPVTEVESEEEPAVEEEEPFVEIPPVTSAPSCPRLIKNYIKFGAKNDLADVFTLQTFLNKEMGARVVPTGIYDTKTFSSVIDFQNKYREDVLSPWKFLGFDYATGYVYKTTKHKINSMLCPTESLTFPVLDTE